MSKLLLTPKQHAVFEFVQHYTAEHRHVPLIQEIQCACQMASYKSALDRLNALEHTGYLKRIPNKYRGIRVPRKSLCAPTALPVEEGLAV